MLTTNAFFFEGRLASVSHGARWLNGHQRYMMVELLSAT